MGVFRYYKGEQELKSRGGRKEERRVVLSLGSCFTIADRNKEVNKNPPYYLSQYDNKQDEDEEGLPGTFLHERRKANKEDEQHKK